MEIIDRPKANGTSRNRATWDDIKKENFVEILLEQISDNPKRSAWNKETWDKITQQMKSRFPEYSFSTAQLRQLERDLKKLYNLIKRIELQPGFEWDATSNVLRASDDDWQELFERDSSARKWHRKIFPYYSKLDTLYGDNHNGAEKAQSKERTCSSSDNRMEVASVSMVMLKNADKRVDETRPTSSSIEEGAMNGLNNTNPNYNHNSGSLLKLRVLGDQDQQSEFEELNLFSEATTSSSPHKKPKLSDERMNNQNEMSLFNKGASPRNYEPRVGKKIKNDFSTSRCIDGYHDLDGFQESDVFYVAEIFRDKHNREVFIALHERERRFWLKANIDVIRKKAMS